MMTFQRVKIQPRSLRGFFRLALLLVSILSLAGCVSMEPKAIGTYSPEDVQAKNSVPADGKGLVFFFFGRDYRWGNPEISLDGASSLFNRQMYVLWELPAGSYRMHASFPGRSSVPKTASYGVDVQAGSVSYYRALAYVEEEGGSGARDTLYRLAPMKNSAAKAYIDAYSLVSWFRDGQRVYYDDSRLRTPKPVKRY